LTKSERLLAGRKKARGSQPLMEKRGGALSGKLSGRRKKKWRGAVSRKAAKGKNLFRKRGGRWINALRSY